jgi:transposase
VYLSTYSPELNPIEQFWAVIKSKVKRHRFLQEDTISKRITKACKNVEKAISKVSFRILTSVGINIETGNPCNGH